MWTACPAVDAANCTETIIARVIPSTLPSARRPSDGAARACDISRCGPSACTSRRDAGAFLQHWRNLCAASRTLFSALPWKCPNPSTVARIAHPLCVLFKLVESAAGIANRPL